MIHSHLSPVKSSLPHPLRSRPLKSPKATCNPSLVQDMHKILEFTFQQGKKNKRIIPGTGWKVALQGTMQYSTERVKYYHLQTDLGWALLVPRSCSNHHLQAVQRPFGRDPPTPLRGRNQSPWLINHLHPLGWSSKQAGFTVYKKGSRFFILDVRWMWPKSPAKISRIVFLGSGR